MKNKQIRKLKVYNQGSNGSWNIPTIILKGEWLKKIGFNCNDKIEVVCEKDKIIINKVKERTSNMI